jgi:hypothetical protein
MRGISSYDAETIHMVELAQGEYTRAVRGETIVPGQEASIELVVMGISSISRAAVRRVHSEGPQAARSYFAGKIAKYLRSGGSAAATARAYELAFERYIAWDVTGGEAEIDVSFKVPFSGGNSIRTIAHVVLGESRKARLLLWDELRFDTKGAEMMALPIFGCVDAMLGAGMASIVDVWQLAHDQQESVSRPAADARRPEIDALLAQF